MSRRLILLLALVFVAGIACAAYAEVQNVKVSGDITGYYILRNQFALDKDASLKKESAAATIARVRVDADLTDNVSTTIRLLNERYWGTTNDNNSDVDLDLAYVTMKEFLYSPLTLTVGRQELHFGHDMIVGDVDTNNTANASSAFTGTWDAGFSARKSFDAIRANLNYDPLVLDIVGAEITENSTRNRDDVVLMGVEGAYKINDTTSAGAYYWLKNSAKKAFTSGKTDTVDVLGARIGNVAQKDNFDVTSNLEAAIQFGKYNDGAGKMSDRRAWAGEGAITLGLKKMKYTPSLTLLGAIFSGKKDPSTTAENDKRMSGWDPMYENQAFGDIANDQFNQSNARLLGLIGDIKPATDIKLQAEYYLYWWDKKFPDGSLAASGAGDVYSMTDKRWAGSELDLRATYDYTEDVQIGVLCGMFFPGDSFAESNDNMASELIGSMKVTF